MYVCGPTVYDRAHLGNARSAVVFDLLFRILKGKYRKVTYARNFTDIDDKIITRAAEKYPNDNLKDSIKHLTNETIGWYLDDTAALAVLRPTHEPRATEWLDEMICDIISIIDNGDAYVSEGHVYFKVDADASKYRRIADAMEKDNQSDFVLWKPAKEGEPSWESPWGSGRPGWHIECSAMATRILGKSFDIHGGGSDLQFPHHHNEKLQANSVNHDHSYAQVWMHNGMLTVDGEKMSKSLGNFITVHELLEKGIPGPVIRMALLSSHYRSSLDWSNELVTNQLKTWRHWTERLRGITGADELPGPAIAALYNDMNAPGVFAYIHQLDSENRLSEMKAILDFMGIVLFDEFDEEFNAAVQRIVDYRNSVRENNNYALSDIIRDDVTKYGVHLLDKHDDHTWLPDDIVDKERIIHFFY